MGGEPAPRSSTRHLSAPLPLQVANSPFKRVSYTEAVELLEGVVASGEKKFEYPVSWGIDLQVGAVLAAVLRGAAKPGVFRRQEEVRAPHVLGHRPAGGLLLRGAATVFSVGGKKALSTRKTRVLGIHLQCGLLVAFPAPCRQLSWSCAAQHRDRASTCRRGGITAAGAGTILRRGSAQAVHPAAATCSSPGHPHRSLLRSCDTPRRASTSGT